MASPNQLCSSSVTRDKMKPLWNEAFLSDSLLLSWACLGLTENVKAFEHLCYDGEQLCDDA